MSIATKTHGLSSPIARISVAEQVAHRILSLVQSGELKPGDQLPAERDLAVSLGVSRPSVREAIRGLAILGVVRTRQGGGAYISDLGAQELLEPLHFFISLQDTNIRELYDARVLIESAVAERAASRLSEKQLDRIDAILAEQRHLLGSAEDFRRNDRDFHAVIWENCGNAYLRRVGEGLNVLGLEFRRLASETPGVLEQSFKDHRAIVAAFRARDAEKARRAAARHMRNVFKATMKSRKEAREMP